MNPYGVDTSDQNIQGPVVALNILYEKMPETSGCEKCHEVNGDNAIWCCLAPDTLVYTTKGPIPICELNVGDLVFTKSGLRQIKRIGKRESQEILRVKLSNGRNIRLTLDHRVYASSITRWDREKLSTPSFVESGSLVPKKSNKFGHYMILPKSPNIKNNSAMINTSSFVHGVYEDKGMCFTSSFKRGKGIPNALTVKPDDAFIFGLFIAEGSSQYGVINFHLHEKETHLVSRIEKFANKFGLKVSQKIDHGKSLTVRMFSVILSRLFESLLGKGCENKQINPDIFNIFVYNKSLRNALIEGYYAGDGTQNTSVRRSSVTTSRYWSEQLLMLYWLSGDVYSVSGHERPNKKKSYTVYKTCSNHTKCTPHKHGHLLGVKSLNIEPFDGYVYDIEILGEESFTTHAGEVHNCKTLNPSMYYVEFLNVWEEVQKWGENDKIDLILRCIRNYLSSSLSKGCVFYDNKCLVYDKRPFMCRMYGIIPDESWDSKVESLKKHFGDSYDPQPQCGLVTPDKAVDKDKEDQWFEFLKKQEDRIGVPKEIINSHDAPQGSYRTFHDHILIELFPPEFLNSLTQVRLQNNSEEDIDAFIESLRDQFKSGSIIQI